MREALQSYKGGVKIGSVRCSNLMFRRRHYRDTAQNQR